MINDTFFETEPLTDRQLAEISAWTMRRWKHVYAPSLSDDNCRFCELSQEAGLHYPGRHMFVSRRQGAWIAQDDVCAFPVCDSPYDSALHIDHDKATHCRVEVGMPFGGRWQPVCRLPIGHSGEHSAALS